MDSFKTLAKLTVGSKTLEMQKLTALGADKVARLPFSLRVLLENLLRHEDGRVVTKEHIEAVLAWDPKAKPSTEISYYPSRVLLQDFTGVPAVADLAAMRDALVAMGGDGKRINPLQPADLVIDHSVQVDKFATLTANKDNTDLEYQRNQERYRFLRWGQQAFDNFSVVPPSTGICHQVNLEYLAKVVWDRDGKAYPDTLVGTDSHTTMINGLGVLGWGVGGIEAEAAMLGQPISMLIPQVVGFKLKGKVKEGTTATDVVLTATQMLRAHGVVGRFVEFFGPGMRELPLTDRATIANMAPEYGATMGFFPVDEETINYLKFTGRGDAQAALVEAYLKEAGMFFDKDARDPEYTDVLELDLSTVEPSLAGPKRPQDRIALSGMQKGFQDALGPMIERDKTPADKKVAVELNGEKFELGHGAAVIAAITSCTNTSNPSVMLGAGLVAKKAVEKGLSVKPWVKTSLAPGSKVVTRYLEEAGLIEPLQKLGFHLVGYGCTTCIGNSGPLPEPIANAVTSGNLAVASVLSGNRNFEGRVSPHCRMNFLASPPLVVAYALLGTVDADLTKTPLGKDKDGKDVFLKDIWPSNAEVTETVRAAVKREQFESEYAKVFEGDEAWQALDNPTGDTMKWEEKSTYVRRPPFFENIQSEPAPVKDIQGARVLAKLGDSVTTDHISPAGSIAKDSPAAKYLTDNGVKPQDFNSYGSRRGNHEVMMRGTFANIRLRNQLAPGTEGGWTRHQPSDEQMTIYDAAMRYAKESTPLVVLAGAEYGTGSSRDWAAKGTLLLGVRAVIAKSYERIHRSNLIGMGVLPLQFPEGKDAESLGLTGKETFTIEGLASGLKAQCTLKVVAEGEGGKRTEFDALCRIDTPNEVDYYKHGGILLYVLRQLAKKG